MNSYYYIILLVLLLVSCEESSSKDVYYECSSDLTFNIVETSEKLKLRDAHYAYCLIESLKDTLLHDCDFGDRVFDVSDHLGFMFCVVDCQDSGWTILPKSRRDTTRMIIAKGLELYRSSCLFMSDIKPGICYHIDLYDYCNKRLLFDQTYQNEFKKMLERVCEECE